MKESFIRFLRYTEKYTKTDMLYLFKGGFWLNLNNLISSIFALVISILFAKFVPKEIYGSYQFLISLISITGTLTLTGMNAAVTQAVARSYEGVFKDSVKTQLNFSIIPIILGFVFSIYYFLKGNSSLPIPLIISALLMPLSNALNTWGAFVSGKKRFDSFFFQSQILNTIYYGAMIIVIMVYPKMIPLVVANFGAMFLGNLICYTYTVKKFKPNKKSEPEALQYGKKLSVSSILPLVSIHIDNILIFHILGAQSLAVYVFASNIPDKFMSLIRPVSTIAIPKIAEGLDDWKRSLFIQKVFRFSFVAITMSIIYILISPFVYKILFPNYTESIVFSQIYIFATAFSAIANFCLASIFALRSNNIFKYNIWNPIVNIILIVFGAYTFGIWGVIIGKIIGNLFSSLYSFSLQNNF